MGTYALKSSKPKLCKDCAYHVTKVHYCTFFVNVITGERASCEDVRADPDLCGLPAASWKAEDPAAVPSDS